MLFILLIRLVPLFVLIAGTSLDFCSKDLYPSSEPNNDLQFTKELRPWEYAVDSVFKSLHCCAKGYLSIEWFKDGRPYPWPGDVSSFILYPEAANQTIYTKVLKVSDAGNYTCRLHNDTRHSVHKTELKVLDSSGYTGHPLATYRPQPTSLADVGQSTRLFCEAFVGHIDLPDASNEVKWVKEGIHSHLPTHATVDHINRDKGQIVGAYLTITNILESDFGMYSCSISNTGDQNIVLKTELRAFASDMDELCSYDLAIVFIFALSTVVFLCILVYMKKLHSIENSPVHQLVNKMVEMSRNLRNKQLSGVIILYGDGDDTFIEDKLLPSLRANSRYCPFPLKISTEWGLTEDNKELCERVGKVIIVLSKHSVRSWTKDGINESLRNTMTINAHYCVILKQVLPNDLEDGNKFFHGQKFKFTLTPWDEESFAIETLFKNEELERSRNLRLNSHRITIKRFIPIIHRSAEENV
uniref:Soluble interferon alpha/beta receptor OPG204 n=1 Tax=Lygus hesperus TaxID=30085 RepID=A0A0A9YID1_LYGHE